MTRPDMQRLHFTLSDKGGAVYLQIADGIRSAIQNGQLVPGEKLPSCRNIAEDLGVHRNTVMTSLNELKAQGWITSHERSRYAVSSDLPDKYFSARKYFAEPKESNIRVTFARKPNVGLVDDHDVEMPFKFSTGGPDVRLFPLDEFRSCVADSLRKPNGSLMGYGDPRGTPRLRGALGDYLRKVRGLTDRDIFVLNGSQEGTYLLSHLFLKAGDAAAIEGIGFPPAIEAIRSTGASIVPIRVNESGLDPDDLERKLKKNNIRLLYLTPLHQYPTTVTLAIENRARIYALATKHRFVIIEDDYDHEYHYTSQPLAPMAANDPAGLVMYVSSFSKLLFPSIRVGFLGIPKYVTYALQDLRKTINYQNNTIIQEAVGRWIEGGGLERHLRKTRRVYGQRRDALCAAIDELRANGFALDYRRPDGGTTIWLNTHSDSNELTRLGAARGVRLTADAVSYINPRVERTHLRLGFAAHNEEEIRAGTKLLSEFLSSPTGAARKKKQATK
ncbi:MAG: MocR-like pyridoxine biosynthesis transcription factor PdxR [Gammaproteobacteria bacterium]